MQSNPTPLKGIMLAGYAKANADAGIIAAAQRCGYQDNIECFSKALESACVSIGIKDEQLSKLIANKCQSQESCLSSMVARFQSDWRKYIRY